MDDVCQTINGKPYCSNQYRYKSNINQWIKISQRSATKKCYTLHYSNKSPQMSLVRISSMKLTVNSAIWDPPSPGFPSGSRPDCSVGFGRSSKCKGMEILFHYPGQSLRTKARKSDWTRQETDSLPIEYSMNFRLRDMEVLTQLSRPQHQCNEEWIKDDDIATNNVVGNNTCNFSHIKKDAPLTPCKNPAEFQKFYSADELFQQNLFQHPDPCIMMIGLDFDYTEINKTHPDHSIKRPKHKQKAFEISISYDHLTSFKETINSYDDNTVSLLSILGICMGLAIALTFCQLVDYFLFLMDLLKDGCTKGRPHLRLNINNKVISTHQK